MTTIGLEDAAKLLRCSVSTVQQKAASKEIPATKIGRAWVFIAVDLLEYIRSQYALNAKDEKCHSIKEVRYGTTISRSTDKELENLLAPVTKRKPKKSTTNLKLV